ncbi:hypothetical protein LIER_22156 [Lithospermum erythrorhizon]|uniref:Bidirectional sugar transporter SWEET n=1 Tax=Lithospermum erythrorhizon TaxID=34254 RepID=A0AAV3QX12_LITER
MAFPNTAEMTFVCGILGNIVSFLVYLSPLPTFYRIHKKKSTEGFQSIPYSVANFSAMLYLYYAFIKGNALMIITINSVGAVIETTYIIVYMIYATKKAKMFTAKLIILFNIGALGLIMGLTGVFAKGKLRVTIVGWICAVFSVSVFAAPLSIMRRVIKTKSVEFMPFNLSICLTLCAIMWFFYGLLIKDYYIATPNILGFTFGVAQMILYAVYRKGKKQVLPEVQVKQLQSVVDITTLEKTQEETTSSTLRKQEEKPAAAATRSSSSSTNEFDIDPSPIVVVDRPTPVNEVQPNIVIACNV